MGLDEDLYKQVAEEVDMPDLEGWSLHLREGSADALIALLLALTPNLQSVFFSVPRSSPVAEASTGSWGPESCRSGDQQIYEGCKR